MRIRSNLRRSEGGRGGHVLFFVSRYGMFFARGGVRRTRPLAALHFSLRSLLSLNNLEMSRRGADTFGRLCGEKRTCVMAYFDLDANPSTNSIFEKTQDALTESCVKLPTLLSSQEGCVNLESAVQGTCDLRPLF